MTLRYFQLEEDRFRSDVRENIFTIKAVRYWNRSP